MQISIELPDLLAQKFLQKIPDNERQNFLVQAIGYQLDNSIDLVDYSYFESVDMILEKNNDKSDSQAFYGMWRDKQFITDDEKADDVGDIDSYVRQLRRGREF